MAIQHIGSTHFSTTAATTLVAPATPTGTQAGDILILRTIIIANSVIPAPTGWTVIHNAAGSGVSAQTFRRFATGSEPATQSITMNTSGQWTAVLSAYRGVDQTTPMDVATVVSVSGTTALAAFTSITPVTAGAWVLAQRFESHASGVAIPTYSSSNMTIRDQTGSARSAAVNMSIAAADAAWTTGAFTPNLDSVGTMSQNRGTAFALRPDAAVVVPPAQGFWGVRI